MIKNRPIRDWLNELPEPHRAKALYHFDKEKGRQDSTASSMGIALGGAFAWGKTSEGHKYWYDLINSYTKQTA